jgi:hypothetical protein
MEKVLVTTTDLLWVVNPIAERSSANAEMAQSFQNLDLDSRVKAFDKAIKSLWITKVNVFTDRTTGEIVKIQSNDSVIRRYVSIDTPKGECTWFIKVFKDSNMQFQRWKTVRTIWKLSTDWTVIKLQS